MFRDDEGSECAFLSFDIWPERDFLVLYELWVASADRQRGLGTAMLEEASKIARDSGHVRLLARPTPLDNQSSRSDLEAWYRCRGFVSWPEDEDMLQRLV